MEHIESKPYIYLPFEMLPEGKDWKVGKAYRVKLVLKQSGMQEEGANFEVVDATSLEPNEKGRRYITSESGAIRV